MIRILFFLLLASCHHPVHATDSIFEMIGFIEEHSELEYDGSPLPDIKIATQKEMCEVLFEEPPDPCHVAGYYNDDTNEIFIGDKPTEHMHEEGFYEAVLIHELVHFLQKINGIYDIVPCKQALEGLAFEIQDLYIRENDHIHEENENDPLFALVASSCPNFSGAMGIELLGGG